MEVAVAAFLVFILGVVGFVVWVYALIDVIRTPDERYRVGTQLIWVLVVLFAHIIGAIIYLAVGRPRRT
ncbi:MAG: PLDc N-terminal domain-containing protein [Nitriliruptoraceae bacterium]|nr:PLDc N-terminal domain-containing protein [Nitriliruptoraceae bacterium]